MSLTSPRRTFLKQVGIGAVGALLFHPIPRRALAASHGDNLALGRSTPEDQGVSSESILNFLEAVAKSRHEFHSLMVLRHGQVIAEGWWDPYNARSPHMLYSLSKSFTSTAVGLAIAEGKLSLEDPIISCFPEDQPSKVSDHLANLKVKHLLMMAVGHAEDSTPSLWPEQNWVKKFLSLPIKNPPGSAFLYNSGATYMLSAIVQKRIGQKLIDYLTPRLFKPLGIQDASWEVCPRGINTGGWGLKLQTESLAKFGQLYLQKGVWHGQQVLPSAWIGEATTFKIQQPGNNLDRLKLDSDWHQGYCYQFWRCRHNGFRGDGAFGQFTVVLPELDAVVAITSETPDMQGVLNLVWENLLPGIQRRKLPANRSAEAELRQRLGFLSLAPPTAHASSPLATQISSRIYKVDPNDLKISELSFTFDNHTCLFTVSDDNGNHTVACGLEQWSRGETSMPGPPPKLTLGALDPFSKVAASGTWKEDHTFEMTWRFFETPHHDTVTCSFDGGRVGIEFLNSITQMSPGKKDKRPVLRGQTAA